MAVAAMGAALILFAIVAALRYDPKQYSLIQFALGVMTFAYTGMLGVFLTALLTRRGNSTTVILALICGVVVTTLLQDGIYGRWTHLLFGESRRLGQFWWMAIGTVISFLVCFCGHPSQAPLPAQPARAASAPAITAS
jgi:Na+/proline symporter